MNKVAKFTVAGAVALVLGSSSLLAADSSAPPKQQVSAAAAKDLQQAQKDLNDKKYDVALTDLEKVKNNTKKNEYDEYVMNEFYVSAYAGLKQNDQAEQALEAILGSKFMPPDELQKRVVQAAYVNYQLQKYDKAIEFGQRAIKDGYAPEQLLTAVAQAYYLKPDYPGTDKFVRGLVADQTKAGTAPSEELLQLGLSSAVKLNSDDGEAYWLEQLVGLSPQAEYWQNVLDSLYRSKLTDKQLLQVYRLSADVGGDEARLGLFRNGAAGPGFGFAWRGRRHSQQGFRCRRLHRPADKNRNTHLLETAKKQAASDQPTLAKSEADAASAASGDKLVAAGVGYFGYGDYAKATKDISTGLQKGMAKDSNDARLILGIAQLKAGDKDSALATFKQVKGDPAMERLAHLWSLHAKA